MTTVAHDRRLPLGLFPDKPAPRLDDRMIEVLRVHHYSRHTEQAYIHRVRRHLEFHQHRHPRRLGEDDINRFLTSLAVAKHVAASAQNQVLSAILSLHARGLEQPLGRIESAVRVRRPKRLAGVLTIAQVSRVMAQRTAVNWLIAMPFCAAGLRLWEALRFRVKNLDLERGEATVPEGKGAKDRATTMPQTVVQPLPKRLRRVRTIHLQDVADSYGRVEPPHVPTRKYPNANRQWCWPYVIPQENRWLNLRIGVQGRHHVHESLVRKATQQAARTAGLTKRVTPHTFRHSFCRTPLGRRLRHLYGPGLARPQRCEDHDHQHAHAKPGGRHARRPAAGLGRRSPTERTEPP